MKLRNFTPHAFAFFALAACVFDQKSRKNILQATNASDPERAVSIYPEPLFSVSPEPTPLRATMVETQFGSIETEGNEIPDVDMAVTSCDPLPALADDEIAIVSFVYMAAAKQQGWDTIKLRTTLPCYLSPDGLPHGVVKLVR